MQRTQPMTAPNAPEPLGELVKFFRSEGYSRFGWDGDSRGWSPERTAIEAMRTFMQREQAAFDLGFRAAGGSCPLPPSVESLFQLWQHGVAQTAQVPPVEGSFDCQTCERKCDGPDGGYRCPVEQLTLAIADIDISAYNAAKFRIGLAIAALSQSSTDREYEPSMNPVDDAEFGMKT